MGINKTNERMIFMNEKSLTLMLKILSILSFIGVIVVNALANILPINGLNTGELSDMYPNLFVPTGLTFSIWSVIYLFLLFYIVYTAFNTKNNVNNFVRSLFIFSSLLNITWILLWHYIQIFLSVVVMILLLITLIMIYNKIRKSTNMDFKYKTFVMVPFSLYLGWISVATIANITTLLVSIKWNGWGVSPEIWTSIVILVVVALTMINQIIHKDIVYSLVILWALLGILIKHINYFNNKYQMIIMTLYFSLVLLIGGLVFVFLKLKKEAVKL